MSGNVIRIRRAVDIRAAPDAVFALVADIPRRAALDPNVELLEALREGEGPLRVGSVFRLRLRADGREVEYRSRCTAFEPGRLIELRSVAEPSFGMRVTVEPAAGGARLVQEEWLALARPEPLGPPPKGVFTRLAYELGKGLSGRTSFDRDYQRAEAEEQLGRRLDQWLEATKAYLEEDAP